MTSSEEKQKKVDSEKAPTNTRSVEIESHCTYPNERRERNQIYTLLNISNSVNEHEERFFDCVNGTGWEDAVQGWSKTAPFACLQLQKRARKTRTSESVNGCLYCSDLMQVTDKGLEQEPKATDQPKPDFKFNTDAALESIPEKHQTLLSSHTATNPSAAVDDTKKESYYGKTHSIQASQEEKTKTILKDVPSSLGERKFLLMKENPVFRIEKKTVPIKEYSILPPGKFKGLEALKYKDVKSNEPSVCNQGCSEVPAVKPSLVLPPLKDAALKLNSLNPSAKKTKAAPSQASEKTFHAVSEAGSNTQVFKTNEQACEKRIDTMCDAVKEQIKMHEIASLIPRLSKTSFVSRNLDRCYWHYAFLPNRKVTTMSNLIAMRRNSHPDSMHFLHTKGVQISRPSEMQDPCARGRSHTGTKQGNVSNPQEIPLLSGLFPSLTEQGWGRATPFKCCKIQKTLKNPRISKTVSSVSHQKMTSALKKNAGWVKQLGRNQQMDCKFTKKETISSNQEIEASNIKLYNGVPKMTTKARGEKRRGKLDSSQTFLREERALPVKEYEVQYSQQRARPEVLRYNKISLPKVIHGNSPNYVSYITLNALLVFRPDECDVVNLHLEPSSNNRAIAVKRIEKEDSPSAEMIPHSHASKKVKRKSEKQIGMNNVKKSNTKIVYHPLICPQCSGIFVSFSNVFGCFPVTKSLPVFLQNELNILN